jgi:hypothetical protein
VKLLSLPGEIHLLEASQDETYTKVRAQLVPDISATTLVVCESFQQISSQVNSIPRETIGYLKAICDERDLYLYFEPPGDRKFATVRWPDLKMPKLDKHSKDAFLHGLTSNVKLLGRDKFTLTDKR